MYGNEQIMRTAENNNIRISEHTDHTCVQTCHSKFLGTFQIYWSCRFSQSWHYQMTLTVGWNLQSVKKRLQINILSGQRKH